MKKTFKKLILPALVLVVAVFAVRAQTVGEGTTEATDSKLTGIGLPADARRIKDGMAPAEVTDLLAKLVARGNEQTGEIVRQGASEVLLWGGDFRAAAKEKQMIDTLAGNLCKAGWNYEVAARENGVTVFVLLRETPSFKGQVGFFYPSDQAFIFAVTEMLPIQKTETTEPVQPKVAEKTPGESTPTEINFSELSGYTSESYAGQVGEKFVIKNVPAAKLEKRISAADFRADLKDLYWLESTDDEGLLAECLLVSKKMLAALGEHAAPQSASPQPASLRMTAILIEVSSEYQTNHMAYIVKIEALDRAGKITWTATDAEPLKVRFEQ